ncbi:MAG TPA: EamA family transporter [Nocardioidaceae bacterium]|jgi:drug/metabolite transporter (DMT)-like permease|nr:EamA family transporter [Nocardioidaceae bacterium]
MAVLLALCSAVAYGVSDFIGGVVARRTSAWQVAVVAQFSSTLCILVVALLLPGSPTRTDLAWGAVAGIGSGLGTGFLYRGFASGRISVVSPVSAVGSAAVPVLVGAATGERPSPLIWAGIALALPGIWAVSAVPDPDGGRRGSLGEGLLDGVLSGLGFGGLFAALGQVPAAAGLMPLVAANAVSVPTVVVLALALRSSWRPRGRTVWWALAAGPFGASATAAFLLASQRGFLSVAGVLSALYPATTVLLAVAVLHERIHRLQAVGLAMCALAIALVAGG